MPFIRATISDPHLSPAAQETLVKGLTQLAVAVLDKPLERTSVHLDLVPAERYFVGGEPVGRPWRAWRCTRCIRRATATTA